MSQPQASASSSTTGQVPSVNSVNLDIKDGEEGWREYNVDDMLQAINEVVLASKEPELVTLKAQSEGGYLMRILERFDETPMFKNRPTLLKKIALGLDEAGKREVASMLATIEKMKMSNNPRAVEYAYSKEFNKRNAPHLMEGITPEQERKMRDDFINKRGEHAPQGNVPVPPPRRRQQPPTSQ